MGHLSNEDCASFLKAVIGENTKQILLAHISDQANTRPLALDTVISHLYDIDDPIDYKIVIDATMPRKIITSTNWKYCLDI